MSKTNRPQLLKLSEFRSATLSQAKWYSPSRDVTIAAVGRLPGGVAIAVV